MASVECIAAGMSMIKVHDISMTTDNVELYDGSDVVTETINVDFIRRMFPDAEYAIMWLRQVAESKECAGCKGTHNVLVCPAEHCWNCGEPGHWDLICRNGIITRMNKADLVKEIASYKPEHPVDIEVDTIDAGYVSDCESCDSYG